MIDREHKLPIKRQAEVLGISRGTAYYKTRPVSDEDLLLMRRLDELHLNYPFAGSRMLRDLLCLRVPVKFLGSFLTCEHRQIGKQFPVDLLAIFPEYPSRWRGSR